MSESGRSTVLLVALLMLTALPACRSTTWNARFTPTPAELMVGPTVAENDGEGQPVARMLFSVSGAERPGGDRKAPFEMRVRIRVENLTDTPLELILDKFLLLDADLNVFGPPRMDGPEGDDGTVLVAASQPLLLDLMFPFPGGLEPDDLNLDGLNLRGAVRRDETTYLVGVTFSRGPRVIFVDPWRDPWYGYYPYYGSWIGAEAGWGYYGRYGYHW